MATKILIVDDEPRNLYLLEVLLTAYGYEVFSAANGAEGLACAQREHLDVIVSDILMPVMDGFTFCRTCKADENLRNIPFIFYTATYTDPKDEELALKLGAERFIVKPAEPAEFLKIVNDTIEKYATFQDAPKQTSITENNYFEEYSGALIRKLEDKILELEEKNRQIENDKATILKSEGLLRESEDRFRNAFDYAPIGKAIITMDGFFSKVNLALMQLLGYSEAEFLTMNWQQVTHPHDFDELSHCIKQLSNGEIEKFQHEDRWIHKNSRILSILLDMSLVRNIGGEPLYFIAQFQDISEAKKAEGEIRRQISRAESLVRTAESINSDIDLNSVLTSICEETSRALEVSAVALFMYNAEEGVFSLLTQYGLPDVFRESYQHELQADYPAELSILTQSPLILPNIQDITNFAKFDVLKSLDIRTLMVSRLENKGVIIGALAAYTFHEVRDFHEQDMELLKGLSNQAAQAITNARLYEKTKWQLRNIEALHSIDNSIASNMDIHVTLLVVAENSLAQLGVDAANILLFSEISHQLESRIALGFSSDRIREETVGIGKGLAGQIAFEWKTIFLPDFREYHLPITRAKIIEEEQFVSYCGVPLIAKGQLLGVLEVFSRKKLSPDHDWLNFIETLAGQTAIAIDSIKSYENLQISNRQLEMAYDATIEGWSRAMDLRDKETEGHTQRVTQLSIRIARLLGIAEEQIVHIRRGALLHDIGKLGVPDQILLKPGELTADEWLIMRRHPQFAYDMLRQITYLSPSLDIPYCHHEKWNGTGYPRQLKGEEIPVSARIFAVVDVWDALTNNRPYRKAWSREKAIDYLQEQSGLHFDPQVVSLFLENLDSFTGQLEAG